MNEVIHGEIAEDFFAPADTDMVDGLIGRYKKERHRIETVANTMAGELGSVVNYFAEGNLKDGRFGVPSGIHKFFEPAGAIAALNAYYWNQAMSLTDVYDCMPQKRRNEWSELIRTLQAPDFDEETVRNTLGDLLMSRSKFFAERVDGLFRALSGDHVTNQPQGFGKRMIINYILTSYGTLNHEKVGYIDDLRKIIAKFMGRDEPKYGLGNDLVSAARRHNGVWMPADGGALRIRVYNGVGTAHLEVHPEMAWRLNAVLASLYPMAIPPKFRQKPTRKAKEFQLMQKPLPFAVVSMIASMRTVKKKTQDWPERYAEIRNARAFDFGEHDKFVRAEAERVLQAIGGVPTKDGHKEYWQFDYEPTNVLDEIVCNGCIPDHKSHQFYPTPERLAKIVVEHASEGATPGMNWLEPSAGMGGIADFVPEDASLQCYEINEMHCKVLEAKGFSRVGRRAVSCLDFLKLADVYRGGGYHRVVMNPPFSDGRWNAHTEAAARLLRADGRLVAILPASAKGNDLLPGFNHEWHGPYDNEFAGTSVSVVILVATRRA